MVWNSSLGGASSDADLPKDKEDFEIMDPVPRLASTTHAQSQTISVRASPKPFLLLSHRDLAFGLY